MSGHGSERLARWLAEHPLHETDAMRALPQAARQQLGALWHKRAQNELCTSLVFTQLDAALRLFGAPDEVLELSARAPDDEAFHARICRLTAELYLQTSVSLAEPAPPPAPVFSVCSTRVHQALFAALHSAVNETFAVSYLHTCLAEAVCEHSRRVLKEILSDEVRHARIGWAVLASPQLSVHDRTAIATFMPGLLDVCVDAWLGDSGDYPDDLPPGHGHIANSTLRTTIDQVLAGVIFPGLEHVGVDAAPARTWFAAARA